MEHLLFWVRKIEDDPYMYFQDIRNKVSAGIFQWELENVREGIFHDTNIFSPAVGQLQILQEKNPPEFENR